MKPAIIITVTTALTVANIGAALINLSSQVRAEVAGMGARDLARDRDFRRAVESIVEGCMISGGSISC